MKKIYALLAAVVVTATAWSQTTRQWAGAPDGSWINPNNWNTVPGGAPGAPVAGDIVIFDGFTATVRNVPEIELSGLYIQNLSSITLLNTVGENRLIVRDGAAALDFRIDAGSLLTLLSDGDGEGVDIELKQDEAVRGLIAGQLTINEWRTYTTNLNAVSTDVTGIIDCKALVVGNNDRLFFLPGSTYIHDLDEGHIPNATWDVASTCVIRGAFINPPGYMNRTFGNFIWDCPGQRDPLKLAPSGMEVKGTFSVVNTGTGRLEMDQQNLTVGNFVLSGGSFMMGGTGVFANTNRTLNVPGNVTISGGSLLMSEQGFFSLDQGTLNVGGNFSHTGGLITENNLLFPGEINFTGTANQTFVKSPAATISNTINFNINNNAKVDFGTSVLNGSSGQFTLASGGKIISSHVNGLSSNGNIQINRSFHANADYEFRGPSTGTFSTTGGIASNAVRNLFINNTTPAKQVLVPAAETFLVTGTLALMNGYLTATGNQVVIHTTGNATTSNNAFVNGTLSKRTNSTSTFTFPVGKVDGGLHTIGVRPISTGTTTYRAEYFKGNAPAGGLASGLDRVSGCEYWDLVRTSGGASADVVLSWNAASACSPGYVTAPADLRVAHLRSGIWRNHLNEFVSGTAASGTIMSLTNVTTWGTPNNFFALASSSAANTLPVVFADVKAYEKNNGVQIDWSNLTEKDVALYTIERSTNGRDFSDIGTQLPTSNRDDKASYSGFDAMPVQGVNYYRIKAEETTGKIVYTNILTVNLGSTAAGFRLYPNPVTDNRVTVSLSNFKRGQYFVKVVNATGQEIFQTVINNQTGSLTQTLDLPASVKTGIYHLTVSAENYRETKTFIVR